MQHASQIYLIRHQLLSPLLWQQNHSDITFGFYCLEIISSVSVASYSVLVIGLYS